MPEGRLDREALEKIREELSEEELSDRCGVTSNVDDNTLRGNPFIGEILKFDNPQDIAYGEQIRRLCGLCFYRHGDSSKDCTIIPHEGEQHPKELFGFEKEEFLPVQLDGKEVGHYCPHFTDFRTE